MSGNFGRFGWLSLDLTLISSELVAMAVDIDKAIVFSSSFFFSLASFIFARFRSIDILFVSERKLKC